MKIRVLHEQIHLKAVFKRKPALNTMKKLTLFILSIFLFAGCEKEFDTVVRPESAAYSFKSPVVPSFVDYSVNPALTAGIEITNLPENAEIWFNVISLYSAEVMASKVIMKDDGLSSSGDSAANDHIYSGKYSFTNSAYSGNYEVSFFLKTADAGGDLTEIRIASKIIEFKGAIRNEPPVISQLSLPATADANQDFTITLKVSDVNGLQNVSSVWFTLTDPNGVTIGTTFLLYDDGSLVILDPANNRTSGDGSAGDGIYSRRLSFNSQAVKGDWTFTFQAKDNNNANSNTITQKLTLK